MAIVIPSIWHFFQFMGSTTIVCLSSAKNFIRYMCVCFVEFGDSLGSYDRPDCNINQFVLVQIKTEP
ncbi:hypothetical protein L484_012286 [Morus notabilis]|uniref:Uncharacterized protein n=1 Tax=Morus notabilis TaxID=981085 RepID=W9QJA2_9ROSA|nr:hypothetical protein L484_012286 [Morus notabilis]